MFDPRTQLHHIIWHKDTKLEAFVLDLINDVKPDRIVETGTHMGWSTMWFADNFPTTKIFTVEVDADFYKRSGENLAVYGDRVVRAHDSSPNFLAKIQPELQQGLTLFWLDAHWWPPVPLREECAEVAKLDKYVCLLDDFSVWEPDFSGDTFFTIAPSGGDGYLNDISYVSDKLGETYWRPNWEQGPGGKGVGLFMKGMEYNPGPDMTKETLDEFIEKRARSIEKRRSETGFVVYPPHPSSGR
jgi:hypothetical protein